MRRWSKPRWRRSAWYGALGLAVALVGFFGVTSVFPTSSAASAPSLDVSVGRGTVSTSETATGNVQPDTTDTVNFGASGTITKIDVAVNQQVKAGQVLAALDATPAQDALMLAQDNLTTAEQNLTNAKAGLSSTEKTADTVSLDQAELQLKEAQQQLSNDQSMADVRALRNKRHAPDILSVSPALTTDATGVYGDQSYSMTVIGSTPTYLGAEDDTLQAGQGITAADLAGHAKVVVIGQEVLDELFPAGTNAIGKQIQLGVANFQVVGVLTSKGSSAAGANEDDLAIAPYTTVMDQLTGEASTFNEIVVQATSAKTTTQAQDEAEAVLASQNNTTFTDLPYEVVDQYLPGDYFDGGNDPTVPQVIVDTTPTGTAAVSRTSCPADRSRWILGRCRGAKTRRHQRHDHSATQLGSGHPAGALLPVPRRVRLHPDRSGRLATSRGQRGGHCCQKLHPVRHHIRGQARPGDRRPVHHCHPGRQDLPVRPATGGHGGGHRDYRQERNGDRQNGRRDPKGSDR